MKILLIEDNMLKRDKVVNFIESSFSSASIESASSYNTGLSLALNGDFKLLILDMSLPTFDKTQNNRGGRFRVFGGREIAQRLKRAGKLTNFVILTGYKDFIEDAEKLTLEQVSDKLYELSDRFLGVILYESSSSKWKNDIAEAVKVTFK
jgi:DNA-binding NarL/FixJ family response regulator